MRFPLESEQDAMKRRQQQPVWTEWRPRWNPKEGHFYSDRTEPVMDGITEPIPLNALVRESWVNRFMRGLGNFLAFMLKKISQLLGFASLLLFLLLAIRFLLHFFALSSSLFSHWITLLSDPVVAPFENLLPPITYYGYSIDVTTLIAIIVYAIAVAIIRQFLKILATGPY